MNRRSKPLAFPEVETFPTILVLAEVELPEELPPELQPMANITELAIALS